MAAQAGHQGSWRLHRHYPRWLKIVTSMEGSNPRADCYATDTGRLIGSSVAEYQEACEDGITRMLEERRHWAPRT